MRVAVTGGTGYVGGFIVDALLAAGHEVRLLLRPGGTASRWPDCESVPGGLDPDADFRPLLRGADALIHAALQHVPGRYRGGEGSDLTGFLRANVGGSLALLEAARRLDVGRALILSSRAVYGRQPPGALLLEERTRPNPDSHYGAAKLALETFAASFAASGWPVASLRPTGVYGLTVPIERSKWCALVADCLAGRPVAARGGTEVHGADLARACCRLLAADAATIRGRAFNCSDLYVSTRDLAAMVAAAAGRTIALPGPPPGEAGFNRMDCAGLEALGLVFGSAPLLRATILRLAEHHLAQPSA